eukprot:TRINITY_DN229_c0_g2_i6.p1 TRINITY_DN229_c0_g2~~TRINITY_DN229_c0_g2_i6.p1  ORF type:complete len:412 (+),score=121.16 TRINITY_DN229_c0_g2_i6:71-1306(+)
MKATFFTFLAILCIVTITTGDILFQENFDDAGWESRWVKAYPKKDEGLDGEWGWTAGKFYADKDNKGLQTTQDARFYTISAEFPKEFSNLDKTLVLQYTVKFEQNIDCGGGYVKLFPAALDQEKLNSESDYNIMFGPDICGSSTRKVHVIFSHDGKNHLIKKNIPAETDEFTHLYRLVVSPDNTYKVYVDGNLKESGSLEQDWDILPPKQIQDPDAKKPSDWVDEKEIPDPTDVKPDGWDDIPKEISDPDATKPSDWDDDLDGEWEAPVIPNPEYKGEWKAKTIPNPDYKGEWIHPLIDNPEYKPNPSLYSYPSFKYIGIDVWQVKSGTIFDSIIISDNESDADVWFKEWETLKVGEKAAYDTQKEEEAKKLEAERKATESQSKAEDDEGETEDVEEDGKEEEEEDTRDEL